MARNPRHSNPAIGLDWMYKRMYFGPRKQRSTPPGRGWVLVLAVDPERSLKAVVKCMTTLGFGVNEIAGMTQAAGFTNRYGKPVGKATVQRIVRQSYVASNV